MAYERDTGSEGRGCSESAAGRAPCVRTCIAVLCLLRMKESGSGGCGGIDPTCRGKREEATGSWRGIGSACDGIDSGADCVVDGVIGKAGGDDDHADGLTARWMIRASSAD